MALTELPPDGDPAEAEAIIGRRPIEMPKYRLDRISIATLSVDYAPPHGNGYARPLSQNRLNWLRRNWDPLACSPVIVSRRSDNALYLIDGNHRRVVAYEKGMPTLPAMIFSGLDRAREADLYTKLGTVLGQTPSTRFRSKLVAGERTAVAIHRIVLSCELELDLAGGTHRDGTIQAIARVEWIYARGGEKGLRWVLELLLDAFNGERSSLGERVLEGCFGFWLRYADVAHRQTLIDRLVGAGLVALDDRADSIFRRYVTTPGNSVGHAMAELYSSGKLPPGYKRLPPWQDKVVGPSVQAWADLRFTDRHQTSFKQTPDRRNPAPQQLGVK